MSNIHLADLAKDGRILQAAREVATHILDDDPSLQRPKHQPLKNYLEENKKEAKVWSRIS